MPTSPFAITTGSNTVVLNADRRGEAAFTITNISGWPLRGRGDLRPLGETAAGWLSIAGEAERDFNVGATQQYLVQVTVPPNAAPGDYTFRLDAVDVGNPDEHFTQGPVVMFQVPPRIRLPFPWRIVAIVAGVIVLLVLAAVVILPRLTPPPPGRALVSKVGNSFSPDLAASWRVSDDGTTWTFDLVRGATLSDGRPFTSGAVQAKLAEAWPQVPSSAITLEIVDDFTLIIQLRSAPGFNVLDELSRVRFAVRQ